MIEAKEETRAGWLVVGVKGRADAEAADQLETALRSAVAQHPKVAADLGSLDYISSAGLRAVLQAARAAQSKDVEFAVCGMSPSVKEGFRYERNASRADDSWRVAMLTMLEEVVLLAVDEQTGHLRSTRDSEPPMLWWEPCFSTSRWPQQHLKARLAEAILTDNIPDTRGIMRVSIAEQCGLAGDVLSDPN
jgi:anti-sigma B factor antagonist